MCCSNTQQWRWRHTTPDWFWYYLNIRNCVVLALDEQFVSCYLLVHVRIWRYISLFVVRWSKRCLVCCSNTPQSMSMTHRSALFWFWLNVRIVLDGVGLALNEQWVRLYWSIFEFKDVIAWCSIHYEITIAVCSNTLHLPARIQLWWHTALQWFWFWLNVWTVSFCFGRTESTLILLVVC